jgi:hypothetical protein
MSTVCHMETPLSQDVVVWRWVTAGGIVGCVASVYLAGGVDICDKAGGRVVGLVILAATAALTIGLVMWARSAPSSTERAVAIGLGIGWVLPAVFLLIVALLTMSDPSSLFGC